MIKLIAFDLVGVLVYENDYKLDELEDKIERLFGQNPSDEDFISKARQYTNDVDEIKDIVPKIINNIYNVRDINIISKIKGIRPDIKIVIATNHVTAIRSFTERLSFYRDLDNIYISAEMGCFKPDAAFYQKIVDDMNISKEEILLIDDTLRNVDGAKHFGMQASLYSSKDDLFEHVKSILI